jgi:hypothetical protein
MMRGTYGSRRLRPVSNRPSARPALAFFQQRHQSAGARRFEIVDYDLVVGLSGIGGELAGGDHLHPLFGTEFQPAHRAFPHHGVEPRAVVLQREIGMAGGMRSAIAGNLAAYPHVAEDVLDRALQRAGNLAHRDSVALVRDSDAASLIAQGAVARPRQGVAVRGGS